MLHSLKLRTNIKAFVSASRSWFFQAILVIVPILLYAFLNHTTGTDEIESLASDGLYGRAFVWTASFALFFAAFLLMLLVLRRWALWLFVAVSSFSILTNLLYVSIVGARVEPEVVAWLVDQQGSLGNASREFAGAFLKGSLLVAGAMTLLLVWRFNVLRKVPSFVGSRVRRAGVVAAFTLIHLGFCWVRPGMLAAEVNVPILSAESYLAPEPEPWCVASSPTIETGIEKIVLIVDESVRADYYQAVIADSMKGLPLLDYGEAASTVNCSAGSNALLRWGIDRNRVEIKGYDPRQSAYIWSYARSAGYKTVLIDGQDPGQPQNFLGLKESKLIDEQVVIKNSCETDYDIASELRNRFQNHGREFIVIVKCGAHFPYENNYPEGFLPANATRLERYTAALRHTTARFFGRIREGVDFSHIFMVYTSDHGQLLEGGGPTHGNRNPQWQEYSVPLVVVTGSPTIRKSLAAGLGAVRDHASHEQIFPTLLYAMGYSAPTTAEHYAPSLCERNDTYTVLLYPYMPTSGKHAIGVAFQTFDHFPYRGRPLAKY